MLRAPSPLGSMGVMIRGHLGLKYRVLSRELYLSSPSAHVEVIMFIMIRTTTWGLDMGMVRRATCATGARRVQNPALPAAHVKRA